MKKRFTFLIAALGLLMTFLAAPQGVWGQTYKKVTSAPTDWSGEYLLVYESGTTAYCWTGVDEANCYTSETIINNTITTTSEVYLTIAEMEGGYSIMVNGGTNDGKYIYGQDGSNTFKYGDVAKLNTLEYDDNNVTITSFTSVIRFNNASNNMRFRYFKSTSYANQQPIQLYKKAYTVTYNANGGTGTMTDSNSPYTSGASVTVKTNEFTYSGYSFTGWNTSADGSGTPYNAEDQFNINANTTLYAQWNLDVPTYTITAQSNNNDYGTVSIIGSTITATPNDGYRVVSNDDGYTIISGEATVTNNGDNTFSVTPTSNCIVQINFEEIPTYTVTFNPGNGSCSQIPVTDYQGTEFDLPTATPSDGCASAGWTFIGWTTSSVDEGTTAQPNPLYGGGSSYIIGDSDVTLYAVYKTSEEGESTSTTFTFATIASENNWENGVAYTPVEISPISITANGGGNNGKYYTTDATWRMYNGGSVSIASNNGNIITAVSSNPSKTFSISEGTASLSFSETTKFKSITVTYNSLIDNYATSPDCTLQVATPTFSPEAGVYVETQNVTITCETEGATIYYTVDGNDPTTSSSVYNSAISVEQTTTIKAIACKENCEQSEIAEAKYIINNASHPYTVVEALENTPSSGTSDNVYIHGIVSRFYNTSIVGDGSNYRYYISDDGTENNELLVYRGKGLNNVAFSSADDLLVGDEVTIYGGLTTFNSTKEIASGNYIYSMIRHSISLNTYAINATIAETEGSIGITYQNIEIDDAGDFAIQFYDEDGNEENEPDWITVDIEQENTNYFVSYVISNNSSSTRTAYFKVWALDPNANVVYSDLITVTQSDELYCLVTNANQLVAGKHYIIASSGTDGVAYAMSSQEDNNRDATDISISNNKIAIDDYTYEMVLSGDEGNWTFYDVYGPGGSGENPGYLYASSSSSDNLQLQSSLDNNGKWSISIGEGGAATIMAQGDNTHKYMAYETESFVCSDNSATVYLYMKDNDNDCEIYSDTDISSVRTVSGGMNIYSGVVTVKDGGTLNVTGIFSNEEAANLIIEDGGQLFTSTADIPVTVQKSIEAATNGSDNNWYLISSPIGQVNTEDVTNLLGSGDHMYNLYKFNETTAAWNGNGGTENAFETLGQGIGYLYRNNDGEDLSFAGTTIVGTCYVDLTKNETALPGFNLLGNPYTHNITSKYITLSSGDFTGCYTLNTDGTWTSGLETEIKPGEGFFVQVSAAATATFHETDQTPAKYNEEYIQFNVANKDYEDVTFALFDKGNGLKKIDHRNPEIQKIYISQNGEDYAIATMSDDTKVFSLNFKAATMGQYTLSYKAKGEYNYLHVIDRLTGEDVDMLADGKYTFIASPSDNTERFIVKLEYMPDYGEGDSDVFAYQTGTEVLVSGEGELQIFDVTGRMVINRTIMGAEAISVPSQGVYIFRLVGSEVKTQKIVVR